MSADIGIVGAGVMGSNLALNIAERVDSKGNGFQVALHDVDSAKVDATVAASTTKNLHGFGGDENFSAFIQALQKPRKIIILVPAGKITDLVIAKLSESLEANDVIVDTGNAHFHDQMKRAEELEAKGLRFLGMGISGGAEGARKGPAFFPGGTLSVWEEVKEIIEAASAKADDGRPCATMNGKGGAGSCVKMFHNAGEYAVLQTWGEVHGIMSAYGLSPAQQSDILKSWKTKAGGRFEGLLNSYMLDITIEVVGALDSTVAGGSDDGKPLISKTMDKIDSKGTGLWSVVCALEAGVPAPSLSAAVTARQMSMQRKERSENGQALPLPKPPLVGAWNPETEDCLFWAAAVTIIASYAQMFQCLRKMDENHGFGLNLPATISTFRAGCILQGFLLKPMTEAFEQNPNLSNLIVAFKEELIAGLPQCKSMLAKASVETSCTMPCMHASVDYVQTMLTESIPSAQCVALQRDVFGRHGFDRLDTEGRFNAEWRQLQAGDAASSTAKSAQTSGYP